MSIRKFFDLFFCVGLMRLHFGGSSSSSTASSSSTNQTDNRRTIGTGGISAENSTVQVLDGGAIKNAFEFSGATNKTAFDFGASALREAFRFGSVSNQQALDSLTTTSNLVKDAYADAKGRGAMTDQILIGSVAMAGLVAVMALRK